MANQIEVGRMIDALISFFKTFKKYRSPRLPSVKVEEPIIRPQRFEPEIIEHGQQCLAEMPSNILAEPEPAHQEVYLPYARNSLFIGREQDLKLLASELKGHHAMDTRPIVVITGRSGIGKTQLASEFAHRYGRFFAGGVYWINCDIPRMIPIEVAACNRFDTLHFDMDTQLRQVLSEWRSELPRLVIFDNCENETLLDKWRPKTGACRILVTSRRQNWSADSNVNTHFLGTLTLDESIVYLKKLVPHLSKEHTSVIAEELGGLPMVLHLTGHFLRRYHLSADDYLDQLRQTPAAHDGALSHLPLNYHERHAARAFAVSHSNLDTQNETDRLALALLSHMACFAPERPISEALLFKTVDSGIDVTKKRESLARLVDMGLMTAETDKTVALHRLLSVFIKHIRGEEDNAISVVENSVLDELNHINASGRSAEIIQWQHHLRIVTDRAMKREDEMGAHLCHGLAYHLDAVGDYSGARSYLTTALAVSKKVLGIEHSDTARSLNNLGCLLQGLGDLPGARPYLEKSLAVNREILGTEQPDTATSLNNLGCLLQSMGDVTDARPYLEEALKIRKIALGEDHPDTAQSLNNLGDLLYTLNDFPAARSYLEKALAIRKKRLGIEHPDTAQSLTNLGILLNDMHELPEACICFENAFAIREKILGEEHPDTLRSLDNLNRFLEAKGDLQAARPYLEKTLAIYQRMLGEEHPDTVQSLNNLGLLLDTMGNLTAACPYLEKALEIRRRTLGEKHPDTAQSMNNLGYLLHALGDVHRARPYLEKALDINKKVLGKAHLDTATSMNNLAILNYYEKKYKKALALMRAAHGIYSKTLGVDHPDTKSSLQSIDLIQKALHA